MSDNTLFLTVLGGTGALFGLFGCLFAAYRHPYKRWLYAVTSVLMFYFIWLVVQVVSGNVTTAPFLGEAIGSLFFVMGLHGIVDGRLRGRS